MAAAMDPKVAEALSKTLHKLGLEDFYPNKLTFRSLLEINKENIDDKPVSSLNKVPQCFLRKLLKINADCRDSAQLPVSEGENDDPFDHEWDDEENSDTNINPLDLIVALFLCADNFLQQQMALKMSMCQISVPLLLPYGHKSQSSLMLWALRDIVKEWCPSEQSESRGFVEDSIVQANIPLFSFVRLKNCSLSKSQLLNHVLSRGQQSQNIFMHRNLEGGSLKKEISNGLVEVCWYLPCGRDNLDIFPEPVAFANLRGGICESEAQFNFLLQVSSATFVLLDKVEENEQEMLTSLQGVRSKLFPIVYRKDRSASEDMSSVKEMLEKLDLPNSSVKTTKSRGNVAEFAKKLCAVIKTSLRSGTTTCNIENMQDKAAELGLSVDECKSDKQKKIAENILGGTEMRSISDYKKQELPLQGENWKRLAKLQKEICRLTGSGDLGLEDYKSKREEEVKKIQMEQKKHKISKEMKNLIDNLSGSDKEHRDFFLKWMKLMLDKNSRKELSTLRNQFKEQCKSKDAKRVSELDQALLDSSLGIEHYMREMGLIYEFSSQSENTTDDRSALPTLAAEMLLDGYPLELLDGDASNIPQRWVSAVLMELHQKVGGRSRLLVLTVLGVQSSGKSTLLNTMFGVQFPVSSGRCTRGAYMVLLRVGDDFKSELNYDFVVLIDTEGLKSPDVAQLADSYEHDNQLATFVIGLSDVTIINISMENSTEMKDVLQIAAHAFLRMKHVGKKPVCHFVHQNVGGVSAHSKCRGERKRLLDQLNEMTEIASEMEKLPSIKAFTDVLDYDVEKNIWYIPGLWNGTPPMAPVNIGYSEAVSDFKKHLLETTKKEDESMQIPEFLEWMKSLWKAVKYENFIFSFRNTLVAHAYDDLCKEFNQWEWEFRKEIFSWQKEAEVEILNADDAQMQNKNSLLEKKKEEVSQKIDNEQKTMKKNISSYYERKDRRVNLIEKYKAEFLNSVRSLANEIQNSVKSKLDIIMELKINRKRSEDLQKKHRTVIEEKVMKLLGECRGSTLSDDQLSHQFENMWKEATADIAGLPEQDIAGCVLRQLRKNFSNLNVSEYLQNIDLMEAGKAPFKVTSEHVDGVVKKLRTYFFSSFQTFADRAFETCTRFVQDKAQTNEDYHDSLTQDLLNKIDEFLTQSNKEYKTNQKFEIDLKLHLCGIASREFMKMHQRFLLKNDPRAQLEKYKTQYLSDFLDLYKERDDCQRKAENFAQLCLKPAVEDFIHRFLGIDIVEEILTSSHSAEYSARSFFQYNIQKELLLKDDFQSFIRYISNYEVYVKDWIFHQILLKMSENETLSKLKKKNLQIIVTKIKDAMEEASKGEDGVLLPDDKESITKFINNMRQILKKDLLISEEAEKSTLFQIQSTSKPFINSLRKSVKDLEKEKKELHDEFSKSKDISQTLLGLPVKPQDELFKRVFGCGKLCPFCKTPCEAGGKEHKDHWAAVHRPQGLGRFRYESSDKLVETLCTTDVQSERRFRNTETEGIWHPYKDYTKYYPDWHIPPDRTIEASDYWKFILVKHNTQFAKEYEAKPADVPQAWKKITKEDALKGLKDAFNVK
ncbi:up-regulator of cell proliferation-like isoform 2-T2 [Menidia menidia]